MTVIKICGITSVQDRDLCVNEGADLLGFNVYEKSKRYVNPDRLEQLLNSDVRNISVVVGVNNSFEQWEQIIKKFQPGYIQLHGEESLDLLEKLKKKFTGTKIIKKVTIDKSEGFNKFMELSDYLLCDTLCPGHGGSGRSFNWAGIGLLDKSVRQRLFVAGGINPENIEEVMEYDVYGIDVATGSEICPGKKSLDKVRAIIQKAGQL